MPLARALPQQGHPERGAQPLASWGEVPAGETPQLMPRDLSTYVDTSSVGGRRAAPLSVSSSPRHKAPPGGTDHHKGRAAAFSTLPCPRCPSKHASADPLLLPLLSPALRARLQGPSPARFSPCGSEAASSLQPQHARSAELARRRMETLRSSGNSPSAASPGAPQRLYQAADSGEQGGAEKGKKKHAGKHAGAASNYFSRKGQEKERARRGNKA